MSAPSLKDSRRLTGPSLLLERSGAILDALADSEHQPRLIEAWSEAVLDLHAGLGLARPQLGQRRFRLGLSLAFTAPADVLYAATDLNEVAFGQALDSLLARPGRPAPLETLGAAFERQGDPALLALQAAASARGLCFLWDEELISIGQGGGALLLERGRLPRPDDLPWERLHDVPHCLVTGTNGKSTTVRLVAAMAAAAGKVAGLSSTDWVRIGTEIKKQGDWSGPGGARVVLRDPTTEVAVLETARGGIQRRGLPFPGSQAGAVLNVSADHLGEWGSWDLEELADIKMVVARGVRAGGRAVINADDPRLVARSQGLSAKVLFYGLDPAAPALAAARRAGHDWAALVDDRLVLSTAGRERNIQGIDRIPCALFGAAHHNLSNALAAIALAESMGLDDRAISAGLESFGQDPADNPGRLVLFDLGGLKVLVDFAHNPSGQVALLDTARRLGAQRTLVVLGQAGDRDDDSIKELVRVTVAAHPDRIVIKEMHKYLRGRAAGSVPALIETQLLALGYPADRIAHADSEAAALDQALSWGRSGDVLLIFAHADREGGLERLDALRAQGWMPQP